MSELWQARWNQILRRPIPRTLDQVIIPIPSTHHSQLMMTRHLLAPQLAVPQNIDAAEKARNRSQISKPRRNASQRPPKKVTAPRAMA